MVSVLSVVINFRLEVPASVPDVFLVGSFNNWDPAKDRMLLRAEEKGKRLFELGLELYSGLYYYKFFLPSTNSYQHDPLNPNRVDDTFGGFNSVLEIPIQTVVRHPLLQSAQMRADIWWDDTHSADLPAARTLSYGNLGLLSASSARLAEQAASLRRVGAPGGLEGR